MKTTLKKILFTSLLLSAAIPSGVQAGWLEEIIASVEATAKVAEATAEVAEVAELVAELTPERIVQKALAKVVAAVVTAPVMVFAEAAGERITAVITGEEGLAEVVTAAQIALVAARKKIEERIVDLAAAVSAPVTLAAIAGVANRV